MGLSSAQIKNLRVRKENWHDTCKKIHVLSRIVKFFKPFKSACLDSIFLALLQKGTEPLSPVLCNLAVSYMAKNWRKASVSFIS